MPQQAENVENLAAILANNAIKRLAGFADCELSVLTDKYDEYLYRYTPAIFKAYAPQVHEFYRSELDKLLEHDPTLFKNFAETVWACMTINFGPQTCTIPHCDTANLPWGWCCIIALGKFDFKTGSHFVLWDLGLVIEFPPGSVILIPSALLKHSNVPVQDGETRYSITQYTAGSIFRYIYNNFRSDRERGWMATDEDRECIAEDCSTRWRNGLNLFSLWDSLTSVV